MDERNSDLSFPPPDAGGALCRAEFTYEHEVALGNLFEVALFI